MGKSYSVPSLKESQKLIEEAEREILNPRQSFDMVIPGEIRSRKDMTRDHQWFYALLRNLCRVEGYCWATDKYLAGQMNLKIRCIQKYLAHLEEIGVIHRETFCYQMKRRRRIFLGPGFKKVIIPHGKTSSYSTAKPLGIAPACECTEETNTKEITSSSSSSSSSSSFSGDPPIKRDEGPPEEESERQEEEEEKNENPSKEEEAEIDRRFHESVQFHTQKGSRKPFRSKRWEKATLESIRAEKSSGSDLKAIRKAWATLAEAKTCKNSQFKLECGPNEMRIALGNHQKCISLAAPIKDWEEFIRTFAGLEWASEWKRFRQKNT